MRENLEDIMSRGTTLNSILEDSEKMSDSALKFKKKSQWINIRAQLQQYAIPCACILVIVIVLIFRYWYS